jgi:uncharacterized protein (TIGR00369 family)
MSHPGVLVRWYRMTAYEDRQEAGHAHRSSRSPAARSAVPVDMELARAVLASQPFSMLLGCRLVEFDREGVTLELKVRKELRQQHGFVHGGVISYLVDNAVTFAAGAILGPDVVTGGFTIDYLRPATGTGLTACARTVWAGTTHAVVRCDVFDHHGDEPRLCATGQGRVMIRPGGSGGR